jgi:hypothetical protein
VNCGVIHREIELLQRLSAVFHHAWDYGYGGDRLGSAMAVGSKTRGRPTQKKIQNIALKGAIDLVGGAKELALQIGIHPNKLSVWLYGDQKIPAHHVPKIVQATQGVVKAEELRPDVFWF